MSGWFALFDDVGEYKAAVCSLNGYPPDVCDRAVPIPRKPKDFEIWDSNSGDFVTDLEARARHQSASSERIRREVENYLLSLGIDATKLMSSAVARPQNINR